MSEWKLYKRVYDVDGSVFWMVNGDSLTEISYHFEKYYNFRGWDDDEAKEEARAADLALSILADYLGEEPSKEQLDSGQCMSWKLHINFKNEVANSWSDEITSDRIADWIENQTAQVRVFREQELIQMLDGLSIAISIKQDHDEYTWSFLDRRGVASTFIQAIEKALEYGMDKLLTYLEISEEVPDKNMLPEIDDDFQS